MNIQARLGWIRSVPSYVCLAFLLYMPLHIFLSQWLSTFTGGLEYWKLAKDAVLLFFCLLTFALVYGYRVQTKAFNWIVLFTLIYGGLHLLLWWINRDDVYTRSGILGTVYNMRLPLFLGLGCGAALLRPGFLTPLLPRIIVVIGTTIAGFGVLQYFLPPDFMTHFGYSVARGAMPAFFIDGKPDLPLRVMSTLREPNAFAAYLLVPLAMTAWLLVHTVELRRKIILGSAGVIQVVALAMTQSRSGWLAVIVCCMALVLFAKSRAESRGLSRGRILLIAASVVLVVGAVAATPLRATHLVKTYITHEGPAEAGDPNSNGYHIIFIKRGLEGMVEQPLGHGPGTAGLASIQNPGGSFLTENYYVQIGYELGVIGLLLFAGCLIWVYVMLWRQYKYKHTSNNKSRAGLLVVVIAAWWGYMVTNMLLHTWSNEAVAAQWWLLAGLITAQERR